LTFLIYIRKLIFQQTTIHLSAKTQIFAAILQLLHKLPFWLIRPLKKKI